MSRKGKRSFSDFVYRLITTKEFVYRKNRFTIHKQFLRSRRGRCFFEARHRVRNHGWTRINTDVLGRVVRRAVQGKAPETQDKAANISADAPVVIERISLIRVHLCSSVVLFLSVRIFLRQRDAKIFEEVGLTFAQISSSLFRWFLWGTLGEIVVISS